MRRGSYMQWEEEGIAPQVVYEVLSPGNRTGEMARKFEFYQRYGVQEYYILNPYDPPRLEGYRHESGKLVSVGSMNGFVSPLTGVKSTIDEDGVTFYYPDGTKFLTAEEMNDQRKAEKSRADAEKSRADQLAERLRQLGEDVD
ncbi:MAG: Uma2 family endonuclease [Planctomycetota bacterium]